MKKKKYTYSNYLGQLNKETRIHCYSVAKICKKLAPELGLDADLAYKSGLLHDVGKVFIPPCILKKSSKLTSAERYVVDMHSFYGYLILCNNNEEKLVCECALYHHGFNKPYLLNQERHMDLLTLDYIQLVHTADIYDALASERYYHKPKSKEFIESILKDDFLCDDKLLNVFKKYNYL